MTDKLPTDLLISISQLRDQAITVKMIGNYPQHIAKLGAMHLQRLLKGGVIQLPKDARGIRIKLELTNDKVLSWESHQVVQSLVANIKVPGTFSAAERRKAGALLSIENAFID